MTNYFSQDTSVNNVKYVEIKINIKFYKFLVRRGKKK